MEGKISIMGNDQDDRYHFMKITVFFQDEVSGFADTHRQWCKHLQKLMDQIGEYFKDNERL